MNSVNTTQNWFHSSLVALTSPDNFEELDIELVNALQKMHPNCKIFVYKGAYKKDETNNELSACSTSDAEQPNAYQHTYIQTVYGKFSERTLATIVLCSREPIIPHELFETVAKIYTNQIAHINRGSLDNLTGLLTRQSLQSHIHKIQKELDQHKRRANDTETNHALAFLDIDYFKTINDKFGHLIGDEVLLLISQLMRKTFRTHDLLFRYGGEEFIVILGSCNRNLGKQVLDRFRQAIEEFVFPQAEHLTVSIGFTLLEKDLPYDVLLGRADKALYYAKQNGRNCCYNYEELLENNKISAQEYIEGDVELF